MTNQISKPTSAFLPDEIRNSKFGAPKNRADEAGLRQATRASQFGLDCTTKINTMPSNDDFDEVFFMLTLQLFVTGSVLGSRELMRLFIWEETSTSYSIMTKLLLLEPDKKHICYN